MKRFFTLFFTLFLVLNLMAQDVISVEAGYSVQTFYSIESGETTQADPLSWDIAFSLGEQDAGVFVNEAVALSFGTPFPQVELYLASNLDYENPDTSGMERIYNNEVSWSEGAFNHVKDEGDQTDTGWGTFDISDFSISASRFFVIKLRNGEYKKLEIQSLILGVYTFRYANLDGSNESVQTIDKADYDGETLAYFSIENEEEVDIEPEEWDLLFTRYSTTLDSGPDGIINYIVTGVLSNQGVEVIELNDVEDPSAVDYTDHEDLFSDSLTIIGHDWKIFDFTDGWIIPTDRLYFAKSNEKVWRILFLDFEGSSTGVTVLAKELVDDLTSIEDIVAGQHQFEMYPNPAVDHLNIAFSSDVADNNGLLQISNTLGQIVHAEKIPIQVGLQQKQIELNNLPAGSYFISIGSGNQVITQTFIIQ